MLKKIRTFMRQYKQCSFFLFLAMLVLLTAVFAPALAPKDPLEAVMTDSLLAPGGEYLCGTDKLGRDVFSRIIYGTRYTLGMTFVLVLLIFVVGTFLGCVAGFVGGMADNVIMRAADMMISFPGLVLAIAIAGLLGPNMENAVLAIGAVSWTKYARLSRSLILKNKKNLYIEAAIVTGCKTPKILFQYLLPEVISTMILTAATDVGGMMLEISALSFLGFGAQAPTPEWGLMLNEGRTYLSKAPWLMIYPGIAIFLVVVIFNMLGDSIRDVMEWEKRGDRRR